MSSPDVLSAVERALLDEFGQVPQRASVSFVGVDPIQILRFVLDTGGWVYASLGLSAHPMTAADQLVRSDAGPRAELLLYGRSSEPPDLWRQLAVLAAAPAVEGVVYRPDMSVELGAPIAAGSRCTGVVVTRSTVAAIETGAGPVDVLQVVPATANELAWARVHGVPALRERWGRDHCDLLDVDRVSVALD